MNSSNKLAAIIVLALSAGLAGCMGQTEATDDTTEGQDEVAAAPTEQATNVDKEKTGEATQKCGWGGGWGGFGGCGGFGGWGGGCGGFGGWGGGCGGWGGWGGGCGGFGGWGGCGGGFGGWGGCGGW